MITKKITITAGLLSLACCYGFAQDTLSRYTTRRVRHEINLDAATVLTFLKRDVQSYAVYHKYRLNRKLRLRNSLSFSISDVKEKGIYLDYSAGIDKILLKAEKFTVYFGPDFSVRYSETNFQPNVNYRLGLNPFLGFRYNFSRYFSLSTEPHLNIFYYMNRNPDSFDPAANNETYEVGFGTIGLILIGFHF